MNKHFQELAKIVGQALARRWMQQCNGSGSGGGSAGNHPAAPAASSPQSPSRRRRLHIQQHK